MQVELALAIGSMPEPDRTYGERRLARSRGYRALLTAAVLVALGLRAARRRLQPLAHTLRHWARRP